MIKQEIKEQIKSLVQSSTEGITLQQICFRYQAHTTRQDIYLYLQKLIKEKEISRIRQKVYNKTNIQYYPFQGQPVIKRQWKRKPQAEPDILNMKHFRNFDRAFF